MKPSQDPTARRAKLLVNAALGDTVIRCLRTGSVADAVALVKMAGAGKPVTVQGSGVKYRKVTKRGSWRRVVVPVAALDMEA